VFRLLSNARVVEGASFVAGPYCTMLLSQLGAEVIRFDAIGGGPDARRWPLGPNGASLYWEGLNKGKKSVALNLRLSEGRELAVAIATAGGSGAGIFVTNYPETGFLSHDSLCRDRPDMITARILGHPDRSSAVDYTINCATGLPYMTGAKGTGSVPVNHVLPAWDLLAGSTAAVSILAAIAYRERTHHGQHIRVPLSDVAAATLAALGHIAEVSISGADRAKNGNSLFGAYGRDFACSDGRRVMIVALTAKQWKSLVDALAVHEEVTRLEAEVGTSFDNDEGSRYIHHERIDDIIERAVERHTRDALTERFRDAGVCFGPYRTVGEALAEDPSFVRANPIFSELEHPSGYTYPTSGFPASYSAVERNRPAAAPRLGQHTEEILASILGMPATAIADLHDRGIVRL
jgi:2-methylfumaryl-CoA isomerase